MFVYTRQNRYGEWGKGRVTFEYNGQKYGSEEKLIEAIKEKHDVGKHRKPQRAKRNQC